MQRISLLEVENAGDSTLHNLRAQITKTEPHEYGLRVPVPLKWRYSESKLLEVWESMPPRSTVSLVFRPQNQMIQNDDLLVTISVWCDEAEVEGIFKFHNWKYGDYLWIMEPDGE